MTCACRVRLLKNPRVKADVPARPGTTASTPGEALVSTGGCEQGHEDGKGKTVLPTAELQFADKQKGLGPLCKDTCG